MLWTTLEASDKDMAGQLNVVGGGWVGVGGVPALPNIAGPLPQGDVAAVDRRMEAAGACQG